MADTRDVIIEYPVTGNGHLAGERYAVKDAATAALVHPNAVIIGYAGQSDLRVNQIAADYLNDKLEAIEALDIPAALATKANASTVGALTTRVTAVEAPGWVGRSRLASDVAAPLANVTFSADGSIVDTGSIPTITTFNANGSITTAYGAPTSRTVTTTFNPDGSITEVAS